MFFADRADAGRRLAAHPGLAAHRGEDVVVLGLPRGGVPVAFEVAQALHAPLDVLVVRKLGVPYQPELAMGAVGEGGVRLVDDTVVRLAQVTPDELAAVEAYERDELARRVTRFRGNRPRVPLTGRTVIVVDDGVATGSTARVACRVARAQGAARVVLAVPVAPPDRIAGLEEDADQVVCIETPAPFFAIGEFYDDFSQTADEEVVALLERAAAPTVPAPRASGAGPQPVGDRQLVGDPRTRDEDVQVTAGGVRLAGRLTVPDGAPGIVLFAHGSGSSRHSPRNRFVAAALNQATLGTLLFDLLTREEEYDRGNVFDISLLAQRLLDVTAWLRRRPGLEKTRLGYFGASTGAAAALWAAAEPGSPVAAVVSRGGRPDLAAPRLAEVRAPTLLIVGGWDEAVLALNRQAQAMMRCESRLAVVPGATHLFEEPGTLSVVAELARDWFVAHLRAAQVPSS